MSNEREKLSKVIGRFHDGAPCEGPEKDCPHPATWMVRGNPARIPQPTDDGLPYEDHESQRKLLTEEGVLLCACCYGSFLAWRTATGDGSPDEFWSLDTITGTSSVEEIDALTSQPPSAEMRERAKRLVPIECLEAATKMAMKVSMLSMLRNMVRGNHPHTALPLNTEAGAKNSEVEQLLKEKEERDARLDALWGNDDVTLGDLGLNEPLN